MRRFGRLFEGVICFDNLVAAARAATRGKRCRPDVAAARFAMRRGPKRAKPRPGVAAPVEAAGRGIYSRCPTDLREA